MTTLWREMLWKRVTIRVQVVGTTKTFAMWYIRVYQEDFKWIQCPTDTFVGNAAAKDITETCYAGVSY